MSKKSVLIQAPIKGVFDKEVNVGDNVMVVSTGWGSVNVRKGTYKGYIEGNGCYAQRARIEVQTEQRNHYHKQTGEVYDWRKHGNFRDVGDNFEIRTLPHIYQTTLNLNRIATIKE
jgi:hypothetical protein